MVVFCRRPIGLPWVKIVHFIKILTWVTNISQLINICSDDGLSPGRRQAIIWNNAGILLIGPLGTNFNDLLIKIHTFSFRKIHLKMLSGKWRPFCLGLNVSRITGDYPLLNTLRPRQNGRHFADDIFKWILYSTVYSGVDHRKHQSSASLAFVRGIHRSPVNSPHKGWERGKCFYLMTSSWRHHDYTAYALLDWHQLANRIW